MGSTLSQSGICRNKQVKKIGNTQKRRVDILTDNMVSVVNISDVPIIAKSPTSVRKI